MLVRARVRPLLCRHPERLDPETSEQIDAVAVDQHDRSAVVAPLRRTR